MHVGIFDYENMFLGTLYVGVVWGPWLKDVPLGRIFSLGLFVPHKYCGFASQAEWVHTCGYNWLRDFLPLSVYPEPRSKQPESFSVGYLFYSPTSDVIVSGRSWLLWAASFWPFTLLDSQILGHQASADALRLHAGSSAYEITISSSFRPLVIFLYFPEGRKTFLEVYFFSYFYLSFKNGSILEWAHQVYQIAGNRSQEAAFKKIMI